MPRRRVEGDARQQRHAEPLRDHPLDGHEVVGLERDARREPGGVRELEQVAAAARASGDPGLVAERREVDDVGCRGRMPSRQHQPDRLLAERSHVEARARSRVRIVAVAGVAEGEGEVGPVGAHRGHGLGRLGLDVGDGDARVGGAERRDEPRHERRRRRGEGDEAHPAGAQPADLGELAGGRLERGRHGVRVPASTRPDCVRRMPRPTRSTSAMPVRSSNRRSCWLTAGWL